jgi:membrane fusion protein (multidrug efflux system)
MNVRVILEQRIPDQVIIPRSALVLRSGREVVFTYEPNEQLAKWKYVTIAYENEDQLAVSEGIEAGDLVIYEGNLNLAHDAEVTTN